MIGTRSKFYIINDTLSAIRKTDKKTHVMSKANLSTKYYNKFIKYMEDNELIIKSGNGNGGGYDISEKGKAFQEGFSKLRALLESTKPYPSSA